MHARHHSTANQRQRACLLTCSTFTKTSTHLSLHNHHGCVQQTMDGSKSNTVACGKFSLLQNISCAGTVHCSCMQAGGIPPAMLMVGTGPNTPAVTGATAGPCCINMRCSCCCPIIVPQFEVTTGPACKACSSMPCVCCCCCRPGWLRAAVLAHTCCCTGCCGCMT